MSILITVDSAVRALKDAVAEKGEEFVYQPEEGLGGCAYVHGVEYRTGEYESDDRWVTTPDSTPGCMVGNALVRLGVEMSTFLDLDVNADGDATEALRKLKEAGVIHFESYNSELDITVALMKAQGLQDKQYPWGLALQEGLDTLKGRIN